MTSHWDEFSKLLAQPVPRRESLRRFGVVIAGAVLGPLGMESALAGRRVTDPCKSFCRCRRKAEQNQCLAACLACQGVGQLCGGCGNYFCTDLEGDFDNCGACGRACEPPGPWEEGACLFGECWYQCVEGAVYCDGACTFLAWDPYNCGACGNACDQPGPNEYAACIDGRCEYGCYEGAVVCDGACTFLGWDPNNCGACGNVCDASTPYCNAGMCIRGDEPCAPGLTRCNGVCTNLAFDTLNCGACGNVCAGGETCSGGVCQLPF